jgi:hypothetical protein
VDVEDGQMAWVNIPSMSCFLACKRSTISPRRLRVQTGEAK